MASPFQCAGTLFATSDHPEYAHFLTGSADIIQVSCSFPAIQHAHVYSSIHGSSVKVPWIPWCNERFEHNWNLLYSASSHRWDTTFSVL